MTAVVTDRHRRAQLAVRARVLRDLQRLWPAMDWADLDRAYPAWATAVAALVDRHRATSVALAAAYLTAVRDASGVTGAPVIVRAEPIDPARLETSLAVTAVYATKTAAGHGTPARDAMDAAFVKTSAAISRLVLEAGRETIVRSTRADPRIVGWVRVTSGSPCRWCADLAGTRSTGRFPAHDGCACSAEPEFT